MTKMASSSSLINRISDFLENRQKTNNFGTCKRCLKNVYWSTTKVASHIRSGHCSGTSEEEVKRFKLEFIYDSPKNLVHKSSAGKIAKKEIENGTTSCIQVIKFKKEDNEESSPQPKSKRAKLEFNDSSTEEHLLEQTESTNMLYDMESGGVGGEQSVADETDKIEEEIYYVTEAPLPNKCETTSHQTSSSSAELSRVVSGMGKEEKFISVVYPQYKGRTKLQLIDEILDLKRRNELLQIKVKTYENTINKLL